MNRRGVLLDGAAVFSSRAGRFLPGSVSAADGGARAHCSVEVARAR